MPVPQNFKTLIELKRKRDILEREGKFVKQKRVVDICIPSYKEEGYIEKTIDSLMNQTMWKDGLMNIVVGEYSTNPYHYEGKQQSYLHKLCYKNKVIHVYVPRKGVGQARNHTIVHGSMSDIITTFDADCRFNRKDAMELLTGPILQKGNIVSTYCRTLLTKDNLIRKETFGEVIFKKIMNGAGDLEAFLPVGRAIGLTFKREVFFKINGFPLVNFYEDYITNYRISLAYGMSSRKFINDVIVLSSDRRAAAVSKYGLNILDYHKNYR